jgi:hypothetical protein
MKTYVCIINIFLIVILSKKNEKQELILFSSKKNELDVTAIIQSIFQAHLYRDFNIYPSQSNISR